MSKLSDKVKEISTFSPDLKKLRQIAEAESSIPSDETRSIELAEKTEQSNNISITNLELIELLSDTENTSRQKSEQEIETLKIKNRELDYKLEQLRKLDTTRDDYVFKLFCLIVSWLTIVVIFVALSATLGEYFKLSDSVLIAFITSTTVSVLGLFVIVARWLFPSANDK
jgi:hypothetical protein